MAAYDSSYTGVQIDTAVGAVVTAQAAGGIVNANGMSTTLGDYLTMSNAANLYQPLISNTTDLTAGGLTVRPPSGEAIIQVADGTHYSDNTFSAKLDLNPTSGNHGIWSTGYLSGETFTSDPKWIIFRDSSGNVAIPNNLSVNEKIETPWMRIVNDSSQTADDALLYVQHRSNNDWNILVDCYGYDYGLYVKCNAGANNAIKSDGVISGTSIKATNGYLYSTANGNTITIGSQNANWCHFTNSANIPFYFEKPVHVNGNIYIYNNQAYSLQRGGVGTAWVGGRSGALVKTTSISGYSPAFSIKTTNGSWEIGAYDHSSYLNKLVFSYVTDANFNSNNNTSVQATITPAGAFTNASKREYKENIQTINYSCLNIINSTKICSFNMKGDEAKDYRVGFIADDTNPIISGKNQDVMDLQNCIGVLMKAVQELSQEVDELRKSK